jgi:AcrR family transcriptional regulator
LEILPKGIAGRRAGKPRQVRLSAEARRRQLVEVAASILTEEGALGIEFQALAARAKVTRPIVYRFFSNRAEIIGAVLDDFTAELAQRFHVALVASMGRPLHEIVASFIEACCAAIAVKGPGAWRLMYAHGADAKAAELGRAAQARLVEPWLPGVAQLTGISRKRVMLLVSVIVAAGGAALDGWLQGPLTRGEAVRVAVRAVESLLTEFSERK